jgi:hypothetical protein
MKIELITKLTIAAISVLAIEGMFRSALAQPGSPGNSGIGNGNLPSDLNRIEKPRFNNPNPTEPLGSQQFFRDGLSTLDTAPAPLPDNPLTINEENLVPTDIPSESLMRDRDRPNEPRESK